MASSFMVAILWAGLVALLIFAVRALWDRFSEQGDGGVLPAVGIS